MSAMIFDNPITSTPGPLRSSLRQSLFRKSLNREEICNDDDAERSSLVASERVAQSTPSSISTGRDQSISLTPQKEHYQGCLKLYAENKITKDNAWNLQLIDFMTSMLRRHDQRMENLQTASTVVDASTKIYSFRVDAVHQDGMMMAGGLTKLAHNKRGKKDDNADDEEGATQADAPAAATKKKKRMKGATAANPEVLAGDFDTNLCIEPFFERLASTAGDVTSSNRAFNATLPIDDLTLALVLRTDVPFLWTAAPQGAGAAESMTLPRALMPSFVEHDHVCRPFTGFSIAHWDPDAEDSGERAAWPEQAEAEGLDLSQQAVAFDPQADVEPIPADEPHNDLYDEEPLGGIESEEEGDVAVAACVARAAPAPAARLTDMRPGAARDARLEYSYCAVRAAWAGPAHWRLKHNRASRTCERTQSVAGAARDRRAARARRQPEFQRVGLAFDARAPHAEYEPAPPARIMISRKTLATGPAWNEANYKTPVDRGLDETFFYELFLRRRVTLARAAPAGAAEPGPEPEQLTVEEARDYDYNNENDASYCPLNMQESEEWGPDGADGAEGAARAPALPLADLLEPPTKVAKIFIPYAMRAKKVDMKQLKQCTWQLLSEGEGREGPEGGVARTTFRSVHARLAARLGAEARAALSVPLALLALLHVANEKGLVLEGREDHADIHVLGLLQ